MRKCDGCDNPKDDRRWMDILGTSLCGECVDRKQEENKCQKCKQLEADIAELKAQLAAITNHSVDNQGKTMSEKTERIAKLIEKSMDSLIDKKITSEDHARSAASMFSELLREGWLFNNEVVNDSVKVTVNDTGTGFDSSFTIRLFGEFYVAEEE